MTLRCCPADHIINLPHWFKSSLPVEFREAGFSPTHGSPLPSVLVGSRQDAPMTAGEARKLLAPYAAGWSS